MALIKCKECGKEISEDAEVCPHCGKRVVSLGEALVELFGVIKSGLVLLIIAFVFFSFKCDNNEVRSHSTVVENKYDKTTSARILEKLHEKIPSAVMKKNIEDIKIEIKKTIDIIIYLKEGHDVPPDVHGKVIVKNILDILIAEGRNPYKEKIDVSVTVVQRIKGATGQNIVEAFGYAIYNYNNDTIKWYDWKE